MIANRFIGWIGFLCTAFLIVASLAGTAQAGAMAAPAPEIDGGTISGALALLVSGGLLLSGSLLFRARRTGKAESSPVTSAG
jgi:hypothetical protein